MGPKRVCVLGAGASGLTAVKICREEGLEVICYERQCDIGGLWRFKSTETEESSVMKSTVINTSKEMMAFSDFPPPAEAPNFMHNRDVVAYFRAYVARFDLSRHIRLHHTVESVRKADDFHNTHRWVVTVLDGEGVSSEEVFDGVLLCTGHHAAPHEVSFPGLESFGGRVLHAHSYKDHMGYEDKKVVVVGVGNSGVDIAVELSRIASKVYSVTRRGTWVFNRVADSGYPMDTLFTRRGAFQLRNLAPPLFDKLIEHQLNARFDHTNYALRPPHGVMQAHPTVNDDLPNRILCGSIVIKPNIRSVGERRVEFEDGSVAEDVDVLILATGYSFGFPYLEQGVIPVHENDVTLYKYMYPPALESGSLAVIGLIQPLGAIMPISEMQCRVFAAFLTGRERLPTKIEMVADVEAKKVAMRRRYVEARRHTIQVDYIPYMDELGELIGATPHTLEWLVKDPALAWQIFAGPALPYHYRLQGPHPWGGAREAVLGMWERVLAPMRTRPMPHVQAASAFRTPVIILVVLFLLYQLFQCFF